MKGSRFSILILIFLLLGCSENKAPIKKVFPLNENWALRAKDTAKPELRGFFPATVPGNVHLDLMDNNLIPDPFVDDNEWKVQFAGENDWVYESRFDVPDQIAEQGHIELVFEGLDTYARVELNGLPILETYNMFRNWRYDVSSILKKENNHLVIHFISPVRVNESKADKLPYQLPDKRVFTRKAPYQFGWDWGPELVTSGIWRPVYLEGWSTARIESLKVETDELGEDLARFTVLIEIESDGYYDLEVDLLLDGSTVNSGTKKVRPGMNIVKLDQEIKDPKLWWPRGLGDPFLYEIGVEILGDGTSLDHSTVRTGFREVELVTDPDSVGASFFFRVNGVPVFARGANYIPQDNFLPRVDSGRYRKLILSAADANMNLLRVWGGGIYENDLFYDLCDENGILVWQDFMFACAMYPGDDEFLENVELEARDNIKRLRNHPSIVLWCGNNEIDEAWHNWGWQQQFGYSAEDSADIWHAYDTLFHSIIPNTLNRYDGARPYWPSSPSIGWGHPESLEQGDSHYWGVWWGEEPFEAYEEKVGRFMSEYGFQGFPDLRTLREYISPEYLDPGSDALKNHQKHPRGMELIRKYLQRDYIVPSGLDDYVYVSQLLQAEGIKRAIEAHRRARPYCMGTLYWQLNDCWPAISWSSVDYKYRWKALHYFVRDAYKNVMVCTEEENGKLKIHLVNDGTGSVSGKLNMVLYDFSGNTLWNEAQDVVISEGSSKIAIIVDIKDVIGENDPGEIVLKSSFLANNLKCTDFHYFVRPRDLRIQDPEIQTGTSGNSDLWELRIKANKLAKNVFLETDATDLHFSDNFFDLLPGEERVVRIISETPHNKPPEIRVKTLFDTL